MQLSTQNPMAAQRGSYMTITETNVALHAYDRGTDVEVVICDNTHSEKKRWFSRHIHNGECFRAAALRAFSSLANEWGTTIAPIV